MSSWEDWLCLRFFSLLSFPCNNNPPNQTASSSMSSMLSSQGVVLATAMAVSGTVLLLAFRLQKPSIHHQHQPLRSCISSGRHRYHKLKFNNNNNNFKKWFINGLIDLCMYADEKSKERRKNKKKRVHFAEDVVDPRGNGADFRRQHNCRRKSTSSSPVEFNKIVKEMPANRVALYNGILRDRVVQRVAYSH